MKAALEVGSLVATGPLATVHRGSLGGRAVAVKRARPGVPGAAAALRREARILGAASHHALVPVLDVLDDHDQPSIVLGWADGGSLADLLADGPLGADDVLHLLRPVAEALEALHRAGVAHLDVSPRNVLLAAAGPVLIDPAPPGAGTPGYADPAVAAGGLASPRSDVFGLAACAHAALTGRPPRACGGVVPGAGLPAGVAAVLAAGLDPVPAGRPARPSTFVDHLEAALRRRHRRQAPPLAAPRPGPPPPPAPVPPAVAGRPAVRDRAPLPGSARTWPFERWQQEADAAQAEDEVATAATPARRRWWRRRRARASVPDDPRRRLADRPPPTTIPGGKP